MLKLNQYHMLLAIMHMHVMDHLYRQIYDELCMLFKHFFTGYLKRIFCLRQTEMCNGRNIVLIFILINKLEYGVAKWCIN